MKLPMNETGRCVLVFLQWWTAHRGFGVVLKRDNKKLTMPPAILTVRLNLLVHTSAKQKPINKPTITTQICPRTTPQRSSFHGSGAVTIRSKSNKKGVFRTLLKDIK